MSLGTPRYLAHPEPRLSLDGVPPLVVAKCSPIFTIGQSGWMGMWGRSCRDGAGAVDDFLVALDFRHDLLLQSSGGTGILYSFSFEKCR